MVEAPSSSPNSSHALAESKKAISSPIECCNRGASWRVRASARAVRSIEHHGGWETSAVTVKGWSGAGVGGAGAREAKSGVMGLTKASMNRN